MANQLENLLWKAAFDRAQSFGFSFESGCERNMRESIQTGVRKMESEGVNENRIRIQEAIRNTQRVVDSMIDEARQRGYSSLHENTHYAAFRSLCPIWPFC